MGKSIEDKIKEMLETILHGFDEGFILKKLEVKNRLIRVFVDKTGGITIDDCARISKELSVQLDVDGFMPEPYRLEVSSPGIIEEKVK
jgi:ribosome maturation factor RimP